MKNFNSQVMNNSGRGGLRPLVPKKRARGRLTQSKDAAGATVKLRSANDTRYFTLVSLLRSASTERTGIYIVDTTKENVGQTELISIGNV